MESLSLEGDVDRTCSHFVLTESCRISQFIDEALGFAAHVSEAASGEVDKEFDKAVRELDKYEEIFDPK